MRVLVLEDDAGLARRLLIELRRAGFAADHMTTLAEADEAVFITAYDALVLDRTVPDGDALTLVQALRAANQLVPILLLTARDTVQDRVDGFHAGADDYLVKPFAVAELEVRLRAITRRHHEHRAPVLSTGPVTLDAARHEVTADGVLLSLTAKEFGVLELLLRANGAVVSRAALFEGCWDERADPSSNVVDVVIGQLRRRLDEHASLVETVRGVGYRIVHA